MNFFKNKLKSKQDNSEFIVGFILSNKLPVLYKINSEIVEKGNSFWIGEYKAFNEFQSYFSKHDKKDVILDATNSFSELLKNTKIETIGDFMISASLDNSLNSFTYEFRSESISGFDSQKIKANKHTLITEGNVEFGAFVVNNLISNDCSKPAICLYFSKGKVGFLYIALSEYNSKVKPIVFKCEPDEIVEKIKIQFGITLLGVIIDNGIFKFI